MDIQVLPVGRDNYCYLLVGDREVGVVDPSEAAPVLRALDRLQRPPDVILVTHYHGDHTGGIAGLRSQTGCVVAGPPSQSPGGADTPLGEGDSIRVAGAEVTVMHVPGHTRDHVAYYYAQGPRAVWTGDVLFAGGCGRILAGSAQAMWTSLQRLRELPDDTRVFCGHEYTEENLEFAASLEPGNPAVGERLRQVRLLRRGGRPTVPSTIAEEKRTNPFLRCDEPAFLDALGRAGATPVDVFSEIRDRKDRW